MWNPREQEDDDESWEVRAFAQDTTSLMGTTWPPRSYTCSFCRREFRSAQALGGHMNVHRRDRARLHHHHHLPPHHPLHHHHQDLLLLYHLPSPDPRPTPSASALNNACGDSSSLPSTHNFVSLSNSSTTSSSSSSFNFHGFLNSSNNINYCSSKLQQQVLLQVQPSLASNAHEDLDLELRLGNRSKPTPRPGN